MVAKTPELIARVAGPHGRPLDEDIRATAARARNLAAPFNAAPEAHIAALWSALGKASTAFERHVRLPHPSDRVNHSFVGAWHAHRWLPGQVRELIAIAIAGTHAGMPDLSELSGICAEGATYSDCLRNIAPDILGQRVSSRLFANAAHRELFTRLIFSAHVDADRTEAQAWQARVQGQPKSKTPHQSLANVHECLQQPPREWNRVSLGVDDELERLRVAFWHVCKQAAVEAPGWYQLSAPSSVIDARSLACYAVGHAMRHGLRHVVLISPTQVALEQRVERLRETLGEMIVVPSAFDHRKHGVRATVEDWNAPVIVTTLRDLVSLLFDNRPASCRHLHRIACAMILVEDIWRLPPAIAPMVIDSLRTLVTHFRSTVTFVSTIPYPNIEGTKEIGRPETFSRLAPRTTVTWPKPRAKAPTFTKLVSDLHPHADCLVAWNNPQTLRSFANVAGTERWIYLSSRMCPRDRREVLRTVYHHKSQGQPLRLATDSIGETINATFEIVWREMSDLPSIIVTSQIADAGDTQSGEYRVFPTGAKLSIGAHVTQLMLLEGPLQLIEKATWENYDRDLKLSRGRCTWTEDLQRDREQLRFRAIAGKILRAGGRHPMPANVAIGEADQVPVVIHAPPREGQPSVKELIKQLAANGPSTLLLRQLMDFAIWVDVKERDRHLQQKRARWVADTVVYLSDTKIYDQLGLRAE